MNWDAVGAIAEFLAALGVIGSLAYLAVQVRGSSRQTRQAGVRSVVNQMNVVWTQFAANRELADVWVRGSRGLDALSDETETVRFSALLLTLFRPYEELFHYRRNGLVDDWTWESIGPQCEALMGTPGFRRWWDMRANWFSSDFQEFINGKLEDSPEYLRWSQGGS